MTPTREGRTGEVTVGVDLGGTGTRIVVLDAQGTVLGQQTLPTAETAGLDARDVVTALSEHIEAAAGPVRVAGPVRLAGIGIGASGPIDDHDIIRNDDTLPAYSHIPLADMIADRFGVRCALANDAVAAAIGENAYGAGQRSDSLLMITLGTGIGVAILTPDGPVRAADGSHPEAGHIPVPGPAAPCYCGLSTCWEQLASRGALNTLASGRTEQSADAARSGDEAAREVFAAYGRRVGTGAAALLTIFRPARVVLGGSAAQYLPLVASGFEQSLARSRGFAWTPPYAGAALGSLSGAIGAAVLARPQAPLLPIAPRSITITS
jgi:glucokinase